MSTQPARLTFVYNADAGLLNALKDSVHKIVSPETYACSLCAVTYGALSMRPEWKAYIKGLAVPPRFLHRDEWAREQPALAAEPLPAVFVGDPPRTLIPARDLPLGITLDQLMALVDARLTAAADIASGDRKGSGG